MTLIWLHRHNIPLSRDVILLAVADEEVGNAGAKQLFEQDELWNQLQCGTVINEGGLGVRDALFDGQDVHGISVAEKGFYGFEFTRQDLQDTGPSPKRAKRRIRYVRSCTPFPKEDTTQIFTHRVRYVTRSRQAQKGTHWRSASL